jgi:PAS domain S-box-containing protein
MNRFSLSSLRVRLVLVVVLAIIPLLALTYYNARQQTATAIARVRDDLQRIVGFTAARDTGVIANGNQLLLTMGALPEVQDGDSSRCAAALQKLLGEDRVYDNLGVAALDGRVVCSVLPLKETASLAESAWFRQAIATRGFSVGGFEPQTIDAGGKPLLMLGYPLIGAEQQVQRIVFASLDPSYLCRQPGGLPLYEGLELAVVDSEGIVLSQTGFGEDRTGRPVREADRIKEVAVSRAQVLEQRRDSTGIERIFAFSPIGGKRAGVSLYVAASVPTPLAFAEANRQLKRSLIGLAIAAVLALAAAWYGGDAIVLRQANKELEQRVQQRTKELAHEQFLLRTLLDNIPDSIYFKDREGRFLRSSRAQAARFGLKDPAQTVGKSDFDFFTKQHAEEALADEQQIISRTGEPLVGVEENSALADGTERWVSTSKLPLRDKDGNVIGTFGISREISERKRAEQALAKERNLLRNLVDNLPDLVFIKDTKGRYIFDNASHRAFLAIASLDELVGKTVFDFYPRELAERLHADDQAVLAAERPVLNREEDLTDRMGRKIRALTSKIPYRDAQNRLSGLICISHPLGSPK